jgi:hypothetical protein
MGDAAVRPRYRPRRHWKDTVVAGQRSVIELREERALPAANDLGGPRRGRHGFRSRNCGRRREGYDDSASAVPRRRPGYRGRRRRWDPSPTGAKRRLGTIGAELLLHDVPRPQVAPRGEHRGSDLGPATGPLQQIRRSISGRSLPEDRAGIQGSRGVQKLCRRQRVRSAIGSTRVDRVSPVDRGSGCLDWLGAPGV